MPLYNNSIKYMPKI